MATLPPWLIPANPAPLYATGLGLGLRAAEQQQQAAMRAQALAQQAAQQQQEALMQGERLAFQQQLAQQEQALKAEELGLSRQQLAQRQAADAADERLMQMKIDEASRMASAQREYQRRVAGGEPAETVLGEMGPSLGTDTAYASLIRERMRPAQAGLPEGPIQGRPVMGPEGAAIPGLIGVPSASGQGYTVHPIRPEQPSMTDYQRAMLQDRIQRQIDKLYENNADLAMTEPDKEWSTRRKSSYDSGQKSIGALEGRIKALESGTAAPAPGAGTQGVPKITTQEEYDALPSGSIYIGKGGKRYKP